MRTITLKSDEQLFELVSSMAQTMKTTKSEVIRKSILHYKDSLETEQLKRQIQQASRKTRKHTLEESLALEDTLSDGLEDL